MNLIIVSMESGGSSHVGAIISQFHEAFTQEKIFWNYEISRLIAIDENYYLPQGFSTVYYINPSDLLKRNYDKIIRLKREKQDYIEDICRRNKIKTNNKSHKKFFKTIDFYYDLIYNQEIKDPRFFDVHLNNLNNYPVATYSDLFDFIGYPKRGRPVLLPLPIDRDWKKRSSILRKGHEEGEIEKDNYSQFVNIEKPNPYKLAPEEYYHQEGEVYRIKKELMVDTLKVLKYV